MRSIDGPQRRLLGFVGDEFEIDRIDEVVTDDLVRAGVAFPAPRLVRRVVPLAVARLRVALHVDERTRRKSGLAGDRLEPDDRLHAAPRVLARVRLAGDAEAEALRHHVHRRPQPVVVARHHLVGGQIAGHAKMRGGGQPPAVVPGLNAIDEDARLVGERHRHIFDARKALAAFRSTSTAPSKPMPVTWSSGSQRRPAKYSRVW